MPPLLNLARGAVKPTAQAFGRGVGTIARPAARVVSYAPRLLMEAAHSTPGRTAIGAGLGYGTGMASGLAGEELIGNQLDQLGIERGKLSNIPALGGAALGASLATPWGRKQLSHMAGVKPGETYKPLKSTANLLFSPKYPILEPVKKNWKGFGLRAAPWVGGAMGLGYGASEMAGYYPDLMESQARNMRIEDEDVIKKIRSDAFNRSPAVAYQTFAPKWLDDNRQGIINAVHPAMSNLDSALTAGGMQRDDTAVGDIHRELFKRFTLPNTQYGFKRVREKNPLFFGAADTARKTTPIGLVGTELTNALAKDQPPDRNSIVNEVLKKYRDQLLGDPFTAANSPLAQQHLAIFNQPHVKNDLGFQRFIGRTANDTGLHNYITPPSQYGNAASYALLNTLMRRNSNIGTDLALNKSIQKATNWPTANSISRDVYADTEKRYGKPYANPLVHFNPDANYSREMKYGLKPMYLTSELAAEQTGRKALNFWDKLQARGGIKPEEQQSISDLTQAEPNKSNLGNAYDSFINKTFPVSE